MTKDTLYHELHRPQFHFSPKTNWTNDPNGLVYYEGEYHLFFQHNPTSVKWGNMTWGHAVSRDLVHWTQLSHAIEPDELGTIFSGSAVVDRNDSAGFRTGDEHVLVAFYTSAGAHAPSPTEFTQSIAYSNDRGRTWVKYDGNPVIGHIRGSNRDPKVIWHEPSQQWIMALYLDDNDYVLFGSADIREWTRLCDLTLPGVSECPDFFELPVDGDAGDTRWVFWGANGGSMLGSFDGQEFIPETDVLHAELGANGYAAQTWSDIPETDGRRIQISWMAGGKYPAMPFNQQMSFPVELTLRTFLDGIRLCRKPIQEIVCLHDRSHTWQDYILNPGDYLIPETDGELFDIRVEFKPAHAAAFGMIIRGHDLKYDGAAQTVTCLDRTAELRSESSCISLQILVDRTSIEVFSDDGRISMSSCFLPEASDVPLEIYASDGPVNIVSMTIHELRSIWN